MEDDQINSKWKTTQKNQNGRRPKKFKIEDDQKNSQWKMTKKSKCKTKKFKWK